MSGRSFPAVFFESGAFQSADAAELREGIVVPTGVDCADTAEVETQRQSREPVDPFRPLRRVRELFERGLMLFGVLVGMRAEMLAVAADGVKPHGVDLVISKDRQCLASIHHSAHGFQNLPDLRAAINVVSEEDDLPAFGVRALLVAEDFEQGMELVRVTVDVADDVVFVHVVILLGVRDSRLTIAQTFSDPFGQLVFQNSYRQPALRFQHLA